MILRGNALTLPLADDTVDLVVTSPPYFGLRSYQDGGRHYSGQIGDEATPAEFVDALVAATAELVRVVKPSGSIFVNLGDKYSSRVALRPSSHQDGLFPDRPGTAKDWKASKERGEARMPYQNVTDPGTGRYVPEKSLMLIPQRYAIRCVDELGLILRAEIIWSKPNGLPESVTDRVRRSHESWFHFTLSPRYYSAVDEIREPHGDWKARTRNDAGDGGRGNRLPGYGDVNRREWTEKNPLGKLPGSVWTIPTEPLHVPDHLGVDHFAAYPTEWPRRIIQGWSPAGICTACGEGRRPEVEREPSDWQARKAAGEPSRHGLNGAAQSGAGGFAGLRGAITGEVCACPEPTAPTHPATVLDPFGGTGTTALVAQGLGRHAIHVDMSADYCRLATWRTTDPKQRAKAARREYTPPPEQTTGQLDLLEGLGA
jgi:DNA modification methylase